MPNYAFIFELVLNSVALQKYLKTRAENIFIDFSQLFFVPIPNRKGTILQPAEVRAFITEYVKKNELVDEINQKWVDSCVWKQQCDSLVELML